MKVCVRGGGIPNSNGKAQAQRSKRLDHTELTNWKQSDQNNH
jgi:hypothetical protein